MFVKKVGQECIKIFYLQPSDAPADDHVGLNSHKKSFFGPSLVACVYEETSSFRLVKLPMACCNNNNCIALSFYLLPCIF